MSGSFLRSLGQSQRWLSVGATSGPSARKGSVRVSTLARSWLDWVAAAGLFDGGQFAFLAELQEREHDHAGDEEGVCEVEGGPPAGVQVVGHAAVLGAVEDVGGGTTNDRPSGEPFGPTGPRSPSPRIQRAGAQAGPGYGQDQPNRQPETQAEGKRGATLHPKPKKP